jgi:hypothetical protein
MAVMAVHLPRIQNLVVGDAPPSPMRVCRLGDPGAVRTPGLVPEIGTGPSRPASWIPLEGLWISCASKDLTTVILHAMPEKAILPSPRHLHSIARLHLPSSNPAPRVRVGGPKAEPAALHTVILPARRIRSRHTAHIISHSRSPFLSNLHANAWADSRPAAGSLGVKFS